MRYPWLSTPSFLFLIVLLSNVTTAAVYWDEVLVKHTWNAIPASWKSLGNATAGDVINLYIALKPDRESALIDALYEVSNPENPKHVLLATLSPVPLFTCLTPFQIWRISF